MQSSRLTGSYYTEKAIAKYMVRWAVRNGSDTMLEPSFGDGVFLDAAIERYRELGNDSPSIIGVEIQYDVYSKYLRDAPDSFAGYCCDFIDFNAEPAVSAIVGNPPYVSLRNVNSASREKVIELMSSYGIKMLSSGSLWMPFTIHASKMLKQGGRLAFVLPFEITHVKYAYSLWTYLGKHFGSIKIIRIHEDFFPDVDVETVLLLADQYGQCTHHVIYDIYDNIDNLIHDVIHAERKIEINDIISGERPFSSSMLSDEQRYLLNALRNDQYIKPLIDLCKFNIGYVCADKVFFHPDKTTCERFDLSNESLVPCISNGKEINGKSGIGAVVDGDMRINNLFFPKKLTEADERYIEYGLNNGVNLRYKCRQRNPWYLTPNVEIPELILTVFGDVPKLVFNKGRYAVSNSLLAGFLKAGIAPEQLVSVWYNSLTLLSIEMNVHSLGGGVLVLIPGEIDKLEVIRTVPENISFHIFDSIDKSIKNDGVQAAYELGDKLVLSELYGFTDRQIQQIRDGIDELRYWRLPRSRRNITKR